MKDPNVVFGGRLTWGEILLGVIVAWIMCALAGSGCAREPDVDGASKQLLCAPRAGDYRVQYFNHSGTCGAIPIQVEEIVGQPQEVPYPCTSGKFVHSADNCTVTGVEIVCPQEGVAPGAVSILNSKIEWLQDGSKASESMTIEVKEGSGAIRCQGSYDAILIRQP